LQYFIVEDFRYFSYINQAMPDDLPEKQFYHPLKKVLVLIVKPWRIISSYLMVASPSMLYCLSEEPPLRSSRHAEYSIMFRYMPLSSGVSFQIAELDNEDRFRRLTIRTFMEGL